MNALFDLSASENWGAELKKPAALPVADNAAEWLKGLSSFDDLMAMKLPEIREGKYDYGNPKSGTERSRKSRGIASKQRKEDVCVMDFETNQFDGANPVFPFLCVLYANNFDAIVIWEDEPTEFIRKVIDAITALPRSYTIYAHNGGKFDYMFLLHKLRGKVSFKGRGLMAAEIGNHRLRDSFLIIPERLANYKKTKFDYNLLAPGIRNKHRQTIIEYCIDDCKNTLEIITDFVNEYGFKLTIGQAALSKLKQSYTFKNTGAVTDLYLRPFFFGGRVQCLKGMGEFHARTNETYKLYDINSAYPFAMATASHPIGAEYIPRRGDPNASTVFVECTGTSRGAFAQKVEGNGETQFPNASGRFRASIWEFNKALQLGLFRCDEIHFCIDNPERTTFADFINPIYYERQQLKERIKEIQRQSGASSNILDELQRRSIILKLTMNNAYGKFAQNPRRFKEYYLTDYGERPPEKTFADWGLTPTYEHLDLKYAIWERPNPGERFNNVGTAASITGFVRSMLMEAIHNAEEPIYCDTDSLICREIHNVKIHESELGAWDLEGEYSSVAIAGKKLYAAVPVGVSSLSDPKIKVRSKGVSGLDYRNILHLINGAEIVVPNLAPTLTRQGRQYFLKRNIRATAERLVA